MSDAPKTPEEQALAILDKAAQPSDLRGALSRADWAVTQQALETLDRGVEELNRARATLEKLRAAGLPAPWAAMLM